MEAVCVEELVEDDALSRKPVERVVLIILVPVAVDTDALSTVQMILLLNEEAADFRLMWNELVDSTLCQSLHLKQNFSH